jgi:two-component system LytT family response regulator
MTTIIIDDEKRARVSLSLLLQEYCPSVTILAECENLSQGVKAIRKLKPDVVLLDIEMPGHSGLELLDFFDENEVDFSIIFTTAYNEYALRAFKFSAVDYLLKPIVPEELVDAFNRVEKQKQKLLNYSLLKANVNQSNVGKIAVPLGSSFVFLDVDQIVYIKGEGAYAEINMADQTKHMVSRNLKNFEDILCQDSNFIRGHKSFIINLAFVKSYNKADGGSLLLPNNLSIPLSPEKIQLVLEKIQLIKRSLLYPFIQFHTSCASSKWIYHTKNKPLSQKCELRKCELGTGETAQNVKLKVLSPVLVQFPMWISTQTWCKTCE